MDSVLVYDVLIIGSGPAGIAAALELQKHRPTPRLLIVEARDRVGGRTHTDTVTFNSKEPIDTGARWIHHFRPENPLTTHHTPSEHDNIHYGFDIRSATLCLDADGTPLPEALLQRGEEIVEGWRTKLERYASAADDDVSIFDVVRDEYERIDDEQLRRVVDMNLAFIAHYEANDLDQLSAKSFAKSDDGVQVCDLTLPIGMGTFIAQIAQRHHLPIQLNTIVTDITIPDEPSEWIRVTTNDQREYRSRYVLITVPIGCLKARTIWFHPPLPEWKQHAIDQMGIGLLNKIFIQFPYTFWDATKEDLYIASNRFRFFVCEPADRMLIAFVAGALARQLEQQTDEEIIEQIVQSLRPIFADMPQPTKWLVTRWGRDPFARGSYSNFQVGASGETVEALARACFDGRVQWAGEHANHGGTLGCVDSAFESGQRTGKRICDMLHENQQNTSE